MRKASKKYVEASKKVEKNNAYSIDEAIRLVKETSITKFDGTVEVAIKLNVDPKKADQQLRGSLVLPNGTGKSKKILVIAKGEAAKTAKEAGADFVGDTDMIEKIQKENWFDYDVIIATPEMMPELGKIGRILGPKGLMPNPKTGTVTPNPVKTIEDIKKGMVEFRTDSYGNIHTIVGKVSFDESKLVENLTYIINTISKLKPASVKGKFITNISVASTMGPGIKLDKNSFDI
ncbi:MAG: 50S ribosomal protein L1 [Bacilli bacterium]|nr:50S ribosomal protein L1 [Bacilli bacterium]